MPKKTKEEYKQEAIETLNYIYDKLEANKMPFDKINTREEAIKSLDDEERFERYMKYKASIDEREEQKDLLDQMVEENPDYQALLKGPFERCFSFYLNLGDDEKTKANNEEVADKYCTIEGRAEMVQEAIQNLLKINPKKIFDKTDDPRKMADSAAKKPLLYEQAFLVNKICDCPELSMNKEIKEILRTQNTFFQSLNPFIQSLNILGSEFNFLNKNEIEFPDIDVAAQINSIFAFRTSDPLYRPCEALLTAKININAANEFKKKMEENKEVNFDQEIYGLKAENADGKEVALDKIVEKNISVRARTEKELEDFPMDEFECILDEIEANCIVLRDTSATHANKKKPGFFSWLFNTKYYKDYKTETDTIIRTKAVLREKGISEEAIVALCNAKADSELEVRLALEEKEQQLYKTDFGYSKSNAEDEEIIEGKKLLIVEEAHLSEKQGMKEKEVNESESFVSNEIDLIDGESMMK